MSYKSEIIDRICAISVRADSYVEGELYSTNSEEAGDTEETTIFLQVILILIKELGELGIMFTHDLDDLVTNSRYVQGLIALREFFDKKYLHMLLSNDETFKQRCNGTLISIDTEQRERVTTIINICRHTNVGDPAKLEEIEPLEEGMYSNRLFDKHLEAVIDISVQKSKLTDSTVTMMSSVFSSVAFIAGHWNALWGMLEGQQASPYDCDAAFKLFAGDWLEPTCAEQYNWILSLPTPELKTTDTNIKALTDLYNRRGVSTPGYINYYVSKKIAFTVLDIRLLYIHAVLHEYGRTRETFRPVKWLLVSPKQLTVQQTMLDLLHSYMVSNRIMPSVVESVYTTMHAALRG